jgi:hypothetical protein
MLRLYLANAAFRAICRRRRGVSDLARASPPARANSLRAFDKSRFIWQKETAVCCGS